jgi:hypothetical protein
MFFYLAQIFHCSKMETHKTCGAGGGGDECVNHNSIKRVKNY